ncbi:phospholipid-transporting ATPase ABCA3-like [Anopheles aquasalis]|uniref:phospholipid-transporting ATPase ABCA3-like n=1 Tax=Anopheles aquasalis TaxID=42839 RepID=UPI00215B20DC|nr:phospholipid-transporting ATPase ABCA3-like [Anopheles aquasalis]
MSASSNWDKFVLLLWKNWIIQKRHYMQTLFEIVIPVVACSMLIMVRGLNTPKHYTKATVHEPLNLLSLAPIREMLTNNPITLKILYSPRNDVFERVIGRAARMLGTDVQYQGYNDTDRMFKDLIANNFLAGVEFGDEYTNITELPKQLTVNLRFPSEMRTAMLPGASLWASWQTFSIFPRYQMYGARAVNVSDGGYPANYFAEGFASLQNAISLAVHELRGGTSGTSLPNVLLRRFPYPPFYNDPLLFGLESLFPVIIMIAFFYSCINTVKFIALEKERQLKESMKVMGLSGWIHWAAWFVRTFLLMSLSIILVTVLLTCNLTTNTTVAIFEFSNPFLIWTFLVVFGITTIMFCFMLSTFFSKANIAAGMAGIVWFYSLAPYQLTFNVYQSMSFATKLAMSLWSNTAMAYGCSMIMKHEGTAMGLQWNNLFQPVSVDDSLTMAHVFGMLVFDALLYLAIALYVEQIAPGQFGVPRPWNFLFTRAFWVDEVFCWGTATESTARSDEEPAERARLNSSQRYLANMECEPTDKPIGIATIGLRKVYDAKPVPRVAVQGLTVNFYRDQITVLLGHNGAGKTTTMGMLTGMFPPTDGSATIEGHPIGQKRNFRSVLGFCPQHNVLFDELTVAEHIRFFAMLKGVTGALELEAEIGKYLRALELECKRDAPSHTLSGGMKRRLSLAVALCGGSKVVFADEPTSGMDPGARRTVWELLQREKRDRTIVLSTHFMDEADVLGDRVAVMCDGELRAIGTPFFLKKRFGAGYRLVCVKRPDCQPEVLTKLLGRFVPNVAIESDIGTELSYRLPEQYRGSFQAALQELEKNVERCGISSYGISLSTMEEVFMRLGSDDLRIVSEQNGTGPKQHETAEQHHQDGVASAPQITITETYEPLTGNRLRYSRIRAMVIKKHLSFIRSWKISTIQVLLPTAFVLLVMGIVQIMPNQTMLPPLKITLASYDHTSTVLSVHDQSTAIAKAYGELIREAKGRTKAASHDLIVTEQDFGDFILDKYGQSVYKVNRDYMIGCTLNTGTNVHTVWFNNKGFHTAPLTLSLLHNAIARTVCHNCSITIVNKPLPYSTHVRFLRTQIGSNLGFQLSFNTGFAMAFVGAFYIMYYVRERASGSKLLQFVAGVEPLTFWGVSFLCDLAVYCVAMALYIATLAEFGEEGWSTAAELWRVVLVFLCFGLAVLPFTYLGAYCFGVPSTGFIKMLIFNIFSGTVMFTAVFLLQVKEFSLTHVAERLEWVFMVFPVFALTHGLNNIGVMETKKQICGAFCEATPFCTEKILCKLRSECCELDIFAFSPRGISRNLVFMLTVAVVCFTILLLKEYRLLAGIKVGRLVESFIIHRKHHHASSTISGGGGGGGGGGGDSREEREAIALQEDSDVTEERARVQRLCDDRIPETDPPEALLVLRDLSKRYGFTLMAVNRLTFAVGARECFGLLGVNGAGKTSTFRMLTGDRKPTSGDAWIGGYSLRTQLPAVYRRIGYCPQFDALLDDLTGRETLHLFALLRGIPSCSIAPIVERLAVELHFAVHLDKRTAQYSGGNRRKLSTALALLGDPAVVYLDEPTTGMDPGAKRHFWNVMCRVRAEGRTALVLTSHSMEECEALCTRLAIMVNGAFRCIGSAQHLKNKFSQGYLLTMKLKRTASSGAVRAFVTDTFAGASLKEEYQNYLTYHIAAATDSGRRWSDMFGLMERAQEQLQLEDYSLGQTSLEQVFLTLTADQRASDE